MEKFERVSLNKERTFALAELLTACEANNVNVKEIAFFQNGFQVLFENIKGDAILHDGSYGRSQCLWETYNFPWDVGDVSVLKAEVVAKRVSALQNGGDWEKVEA